MMNTMNEDDQLFCQWLHDSIPSKAPVILTLFNKDAFGNDSYLELRYHIEDSTAHFYFCGNGFDKVRHDDFFYSVTRNHSVPQDSSRRELLNRVNPFCYLQTARISGQKLSYLFAILCSCQGIHLNQTISGRDGNFVTLKSFWPSRAEFCYWVSPKNFDSRIEELVWLLAEYLPQPAREALQPRLPSETIQKLRNL